MISFLPGAHGRSAHVIPGLQSNPFPMNPTGQAPQIGPFDPLVQGTPGKQGFGEHGSPSASHHKNY